MDIPDPSLNSDDDLDLVARALSAEAARWALVELIGSIANRTGRSYGITVHDEQAEPYTLVSTDDDARRLDESQYEAGNGPCLQAFDTSETVTVADIAADSRWPAFAERAASYRFRSSSSVPLFASGRPIGALNIYSDDVAFTAGTDGVPPEALDADEVAGAVLINLELSRRHNTVEAVRHAVQSRSIIDRAVGILMAQQHCDIEAAAALLRAAAYNRAMSVHEVAVQIVASIERRTSGGRRGRY